MEGANIKCGGIICCHKNNGFPTDPKKRAKKFGSYFCDTPKVGFEGLADFINE